MGPRGFENGLNADVVPQQVYRVVVLGDLMLDETHWCEVHRLSPEAPVPICKVKDSTFSPGGASNVANNIQSLGSVPLLLGHVGKDGTGQHLKRALSAHHIGTDLILEDDQRPTTLKSRIVARHQQVVRVDREDSSELSPTQQSALLASFELALKQAHAVVLSDYSKGVLTPELTASCIERAREKGIPVVVDPKGHDYVKYNGASILTPNFSEFCEANSGSMDTEEAILEAGVRMIRELRLKALVVTRSEKGMSVITEDGAKHDISTKAVEVTDITGAGDTVIAGLAIGLASGMAVEKAAYFANFAAGVVVGKMGTSTVSLAEVQHAISKH